MNSFPPSQHHSFAATSQTYASALISSTPSLSPKYKNKYNNNKKHTSWADQVENSNNTQNKKQKLNQIMNWPTKNNINNKNKRPQLQARNTNYTYQHKDGDKQNKVWELAQRVEDEERKKKDIMLAAHIQQNNNNNNNINLNNNDNNGDNNNRGEIDNFGDSLSSISCDSYSTISGDSMSCESLGGERERETETDNNQQKEGEEGEKKKKKKKNKKRKRKYSAAEEGKKVFVGGITFEECDSFLTKENETLSSIRYKKFSQIFYLFGSINRIQGHWESGVRYCFVVFSKRRDAKLAIKCLSMAKVRRKAPAGVLPLPSFYVRWANNPNSSSLSSSLSPSSSSSSAPSLSSIPSNLGDTKQQENSEMEEREDTDLGEEREDDTKEREMEWIHTMNEEEMVEEDVERLMRELLKLHNN